MDMVNDGKDIRLDTPQAVKEAMKGATYEDSRKVDDLLDSHGDKPISDYRKRPQGMSLKQAVREAREASAKLAEENGGTDAPDGKDER